MRTLLALILIVTTFAQPALAQDNPANPPPLAWTVFVEPEFGTQVDMPNSLFSTPDGTSYRGVGQTFKTADGRAVLAVYSMKNQGDTPRSFLNKVLNIPRSALDYERVTRSFFAISAIHEGETYYGRCNFARRNGLLHCFDVKYPQSEERAWDGIVTRMSRSLRPLERD